MRIEWGQPVSDDDSRSPVRDSEDRDLMLREREAGDLDRFDWSVMEAIVWIATRDEAAVRGAAGYLAREPRGMNGFLAPGLRLQGALRTRAEEVLRTLLSLDVADHHSDCPMFIGDGTCSCGELGRIRYCRCPDRLGSRVSTCGCTAAAELAFLEAFRGNLSVSGKRDGEIGYDTVDAGKRVGASLTFSRHDGFRLWPAYVDLRIPVQEIMQRWPADFSDRAIGEPTLASPIPGEVEVGRPARMQHEALTIFVQRMRAGHTKWPAADEARRIAGAAATAKNEESIARWMRPYYRRLFTNKRLDPTAVAAVIAEIERDLEAARRRRAVPD